MSPAPLVGIPSDATPEEVAAVLATFAVLEAQRSVAVDDAATPTSNWVRASRLTARRAGLQRGEYRLSGRIGRRSRA
ncbi:MAG: acyl-CoA carboxylase epsilon subunit [Actinomycetes bacterium]